MCCAAMVEPVKVKKAERARLDRDALAGAADFIGPARIQDHAHLYRPVDREVGQLRVDLVAAEMGDRGAQSGDFHSHAGQFGGVSCFIET